MPGNTEEMKMSQYIAGSRFFSWGRTEVTRSLLVLFSLRYPESIVMNYDELGSTIRFNAVIADQRNRRSSAMILDKSDALGKFQ